MVPSYNIHINKYVIRGLLQMPIKLIENMCTKETKKTTNTQKPKKLKESYDYRDFDIRQADEVLEGMMGNASDEYIDKTIKIFNFIRHQFKVPRIDDLFYVRVSDELSWYLEDLSEVKNQKSFKGSDWVQIFDLETEDFGTITFARERSGDGYIEPFYFKSAQDVENAVKWVNKQQERYENN